MSQQILVCCFSCCPQFHPINIFKLSKNLVIKLKQMVLYFLETMEDMIWPSLGFLKEEIKSWEKTFT